MFCVQSGTNHFRTLDNVGKKMDRTLASTDGRLELWNHAVHNNGRFNLQWKACFGTIELTPRGKRVRSGRVHLSCAVVCFVCIIWGVFAPGGFGGVSRFYDAWYVRLPCLVVVTSYTWCDVVC